MSDGRFSFRPIAWVESPLVDPALAPKQGDEGAPEAWLIFEVDVRDALRDLKVGTDMIVLTWLDRASREVLVVHPRGDPSRPATGVFNTRSPDRPNPVGLHRVKILSIDGLRVQVGNLEALDGTPVIDLKPVLGEVPERSSRRVPLRQADSGALVPPGMIKAGKQFRPSTLRCNLTMLSAALERESSQPIAIIAGLDKLHSVVVRWRWLVWRASW